MSRVTSSLVAGTATITWDHTIVPKMIPGIEAGLTAAAAAVAERARLRIGKKHGGISSRPGESPHSQTGHLMRSISHASPRQLGTPLRAAAGTNVKYGRYLEFGAVSTPKSAKRIIIPLNRAARRLLVRSGPAEPGAGRRAIESMGYANARHGGGRTVAFIHTKNGDILVAQTDKRGKVLNGQPKFLLAKQAVIAPRPWLRPALAQTPVVAIAQAMTTRQWRARGLVK